MEKLLILVLSVIFNCGSSLKCHVCNSQLSTACLDPFNISESLQECDRSGGPFGGGGKLLDVVDIIMQTGDDGEASQPPVKGDKPSEDTKMVCQKIVVTVGNDSITGRGCAPMTVSGMHPCDAVRLSAPGNVRHCVTCSSDACNDASLVRPTPKLLFTTIGGVLGVVWVQRIIGVAKRFTRKG